MSSVWWSVCLWHFLKFCFHPKFFSIKICFHLQKNYPLSLFRPSTTVSRISHMESRLRRRCHCHWCGGPPPHPPAGWPRPQLGYSQQVECDKAGSLMESCLCHDHCRGGSPHPPSGWLTPSLAWERVEWLGCSAFTKRTSLCISGCFRPSWVLKKFTHTFLVSRGQRSILDQPPRIDTKSSKVATQNYFLQGRKVTVECRKGVMRSQGPKTQTTHHQNIEQIDEFYTWETNSAHQRRPLWNRGESISVWTQGNVKRKSTSRQKVIEPSVEIDFTFHDECRLGLKT